MERQQKYNMAGNFLHIGAGEYVPMRNIRCIEVLSDDDRAQMAERYPNARTDFQYRVQFWDRTQRLAVQLDANPGQLVEVDTAVLMPIANMAALKPLSSDDHERLRARYPNAARPFQTRIESTDGQSFLSTWTVEQIVGAGEDVLRTDMRTPPPVPSNQNRQRKPQVA